MKSCHFSRVVLSVVAAGSFIAATPPAPRPPGMEAESLNAKVGDEVITAYRTPLKDGRTTLVTIEPGTKLAVTEFKDPWVRTTIDNGGEKVTGWVYSKHLRTPAMLKQLTDLGKEFMGGRFEDYSLSSQPLPDRLDTAALMITGMIIPAPKIVLTSDGKVSVGGKFTARRGAGMSITFTPEAWGGTDEERAQVVVQLDRYLQSSLVDRGRFRRSQSRDSWEVLIRSRGMWMDMSQHRPQIYLEGDVFLLDNEEKSLHFQRSFTGTGSDQDSLLRDSAAKAATEYAKLMRSRR